MSDRAIRLVVLAIDGRGGPILLADGVRVARIPKSPHIGGADLPGEHGRGSSPSAKRIVGDCFGDRRQDALGERFGLGEQRPRPEGQREPCIGQVPHGLGRQDVEDGEPLYTVRVVEGHAVGDATAAIVAGDREAPEPEPLHDGYHVLGHGSLCVRLMVPSGGRATAAPVAAKVGTDDREVADKQRRDGAPHQVRLRKAVQQEDRRPGPVRAHENAGLTRLDLRGCEVIHHFRLCSFLRTRATICSSSVSPFDERPLSTLKGLCYCRAMCFSPSQVSPSTGWPKARTILLPARSCNAARSISMYLSHVPRGRWDPSHLYTGTSLRPSSRLDYPISTRVPGETIRKTSRTGQPSYYKRLASL